MHLPNRTSAGGGTVPVLLLAVATTHVKHANQIVYNDAISSNKQIQDKKRCSICVPHCIHSRGRGIRFISVKLQAPLVSSYAPTYEHAKFKISLFTLVTVEFLKCAVDLSIFSYHHFAIVITGGIP